MKKIALLIACILALQSCGGFDGQGSGNIFDDPPDCFYDSLFGCGTFDIPWDSSYYGFNRSSRTIRSAKTKSQNAVPNLSGTWEGTLARKSSSCSFATPLKINGNFTSQQIADRITVKLPISSLRSYPLRGRVSGKGFTASSTGYASFCSFNIGSSYLSSSNRNRGKLNANIRIRCPFQNTCDLAYSGNVRR